MQHRALAVLIIRVAGLLIIVFAITSATRAFGPMFNPEAAEKVGVGLLLSSALISVVIPFSLGLLLTYFPSAVTTKVLRIEGLESSDEADIRSLQRVAFGAIGLWLTLYAVLDAVYLYSKSLLYSRLIETMPTKPPPLSPDDFAGWVTAGVQLLVGVWLLLGNRAIVNIIGRLRG